MGAEDAAGKAMSREVRQASAPLRYVCPRCHSTRVLPKEEKPSCNECGFRVLLKDNSSIQTFFATSTQSHISCASEKKVVSL